MMKKSIEELLSLIATNCEENPDSLKTGINANVKTSQTEELPSPTLGISDNPAIYTDEAMCQLNLLWEDGPIFNVTKKNINGYSIYEDSINKDIVKNDSFKNDKEWTVVIDPKNVTNPELPTNKITIYWD